MAAVKRSALATDGTDVTDASSSTLPSPRQARRLQRIDTNRTQVLDVAEQMFAEAGYYGTSLKAIADECEFAVGTLYNLFADKEDLFLAVQGRRGEELSRVMREIANEPLRADRKLVKLAEYQVTFFRTYPNWARITTAFITPGSRSALPAGRVATSYDAGYRGAMELQAKVIAEGQKDGLIRSGDPKALARIFSSLVSAHHVIDVEAETDPMTFGLDELLAIVKATFSLRR